MTSTRRRPDEEWSLGDPFDSAVDSDTPKTPVSLIATVVVIVTGLGANVALGSTETGTFALLLVLLAPVGYVVRRIGVTAYDPAWLPNVLILGWVVKLLASAGRYAALEVLYGGSGDATGYHNFGTRYAPLWRSLQPPALGTGTEFVQAITGLIYSPYVPTKLGGFFLFATIAFLGQLLLFSAFRRAFPTPAVKWYALLICFFPNIVYWPSSIGKESLMLVFIGLSAYASVRLFLDYRFRWFVVLVVGLAGAGVIRSHIALLIALSVTIAVVAGRAPEDGVLRARRWGAVVVLVVFAAGVGRYALEDFNIDVSSGINDTLIEEELDPIFAGVEQQTDRGGSAVEGSAIRSPADVPEAVVRVVFRPLPSDAHNVQALVSALLEGTFLLVLVIWRTPAIVRNLVHRWREPYILFSLAYTGGFIFGHSAVLNLGIIARQRSQAIPFILALLVALGSRVPPSSDKGAQDEIPTVHGFWHPRDSHSPVSASLDGGSGWEQSTSRGPTKS